MRERLVTIHNRAGIHCRPSGVILKAMQEFPDHLFEITVDGETTEITGILELLSLSLHRGTEAILRVEGPDEDKAVERIGDLFEYEFDFPPR